MAAIPWAIVARIAWLGVARPVLKLIVEKTPAKQDDQFFEVIDRVMGTLFPAEVTQKVDQLVFGK